MKNKIDIIKDNEITLSSINDNDEEIFLSIVKDTKVNVSYMIPNFKSKEEEHNFFIRIKNITNDVTRYCYGVYYHNRLVGFTNEVDREGDTVEVGYFIDSNYWNKGIATRVLTLMIKMFFSVGFNHVLAGYFEFNVASKRVMEKCHMHLINKTDEIKYKDNIYQCKYYQIDKYQLVVLTKEYQHLLNEMMDEWVNYNSTDPDDKTPYAIFKNDYHNFEHYLANLDIKEPRDGKVPDSVYYLLDNERHIFLGAVNIRHYLNEYLFNYGGHIGDGIRPSERRKGFGSLIISLALDKCKELNIDKVLMTCDANNVASRKTIINNGGILENEIITKEGEVIQRYWINLK